MNSVARNTCARSAATCDARAPRQAFHHTTHAFRRRCRCIPVPASRRSLAARGFRLPAGQFGLAPTGIALLAGEDAS